MFKMPHYIYKLNPLEDFYFTLAMTAYFSAFSLVVALITLFIMNVKCCGSCSYYSNAHQINSTSTIVERVTEMRQMNSNHTAITHKHNS